MALFNQRIDVYYHFDSDKQKSDECEEDDALVTILAFLRRIADQNEDLNKRLCDLRSDMQRLIRLYGCKTPQAVREAIKESSEVADEVQAAIDAEQ